MAVSIDETENVSLASLQWTFDHLADADRSRETAAQVSSYESTWALARVQLKSECDLYDSTADKFAEMLQDMYVASRNAFDDEVAYQQQVREHLREGQLTDCESYSSTACRNLTEHKVRQNAYVKDVETVMHWMDWLEQTRDEYDVGELVGRAELRYQQQL